MMYALMSIFATSHLKKRIMRKQGQKVILCVSALLLVACGGSENSIEGTWTEPVPGMENMEQGFTLDKDGKASSVNMATLQYENWKQEGDRLILSGKSVGNHQTLEFSDTMEIERLTADTLVLKRGLLFQTYSRKK